MPAERVIQTTRSADLVTLKILIDGTELSTSYQVLSISVEKEINRIPLAKIILVDGDPAEQDFLLSNESFFVPGNEVEIKAGYHSDEETIFKGVVIKHNLKVRPQQSFLVVFCQDKSVKLTVGRKSKYFYDSTDSDIIEEIIGAYSLESEVESTSVRHKEMIQYNVSDWDFMITRAQANGRICLVEGGKIRIIKPDYQQTEVASVSYGATLLDFDAEMDARNQFKNISTFSWNPADQEMMEIEAEDAGVDLNGNISSDELAEVIDIEKLKLKDGGKIQDDELQEWANAKKLFFELSKIRGRARFQGIPDVKPNTTIVLDGVGDRFNGKVFVSAVRHQISAGNWTCDAQFGISPKWFSEITPINDIPASGLLAAINGLQVAKVTQLENDPDGEDRILVRLPVIDNSEQGVWARVATLDAGENRGSFFRPEIDDEVIVGFINGNPIEAVILGMMNSSAKPAPFTASDDNYEKGFVTRSEMKLVFNDEKSSITIETPNGNTIVISDEDGAIEFADENGNKTTFNSDGISMESASDISIKANGDIKFEGTNIEFAANANFKAEGSAQAELSSGATTVVKGGIVQIN